MKTLLISFLSAVVLFAGCSGWGCCDEPDAPEFGTAYIYKTRADYSQNIFVEINKDKQITGGGFPARPQYPYTADVKLAGGYYRVRDASNGLRSQYSVPTSLTIDTYKVKLPDDSLAKLIIDYNPFIDFYLFEAKSVDTATINGIIRRGEQSKYFTRMN